MTFSLLSKAVQGLLDAENTTPADQPTADAGEQLLSLLDEPKHLNDLIDRVDLTLSALRMRLIRYEEKGVVKRIGKGRDTLWQRA